MTFLCGLDGGSLTTCSSPHVFAQMHPGPHRFEVQAIAPPLLDPLGNPMEVDYDPVSTFYEWTLVDTVAPGDDDRLRPARDHVERQRRLRRQLRRPDRGARMLARRRVLQLLRVAGRLHRPRSATEHEFAVRAIDVAGNTDLSPAQFEWEITPPGPPNTPVGSNVTVTLPMPDGPGNGTVNFFSVSTAGTTAIDALGGGAPLPAGYSAAGARYYDVSTTAAFGEPATVCLAYDASAFATTAVRLLEFDGSQWLDITTLNNPFAGRICGEAEDFAGFAIASAHAGVAPVVSVLSGPDLGEHERDGDVHVLRRSRQHPGLVLARRRGVRALQLARDLHPPLQRRPRLAAAGRRPVRAADRDADAL